MKKLKFISFLAVIFMLNVASTCSNDDDNSIAPSQDPSQVITIASQGSWRVTHFNDSGTDETAHFNGYNFTFAPNGTLTAANLINSYNGSWSVANDDSNDDSPSNSNLDFNIIFNSPADFAELTEDWDIISINAAEIKLIHVSGGNGGTDYLIFAKN